jgi:hypothetical protein
MEVFDVSFNQYKVILNLWKFKLLSNKIELSIWATFYNFNNFNPIQIWGFMTPMKRFPTFHAMIICIQWLKTFLNALLVFTYVNVE